MVDFMAGLLGGISGGANAINEMAAEKRKQLAEQLRMQAEEQLQYRLGDKAAERQAEVTKSDREYQKGLLDSEIKRQEETAKVKRAQDVSDMETKHNYNLEEIAAREKPKLTDTKDETDQQRQDRIDRMNIDFQKAGIPVSASINGVSGEGLTPDQQKMASAIATKHSFDLAFGNNRTTGKWNPFKDNIDVADVTGSASTRGILEPEMQSGLEKSKINAITNKEDVSGIIKDLLKRAKENQRPTKSKQMPDEFDDSLLKYYQGNPPKNKEDQGFKNRVMVR